MTENTNFPSESSQSPFRRYVPPADSTNPAHGQGMSSLNAPTPPMAARPTPINESPQRHRSDRSGWRRWLANSFKGSPGQSARPVFAPQSASPASLRSPSLPRQSRPPQPHPLPQNNRQPSYRVKPPAGYPRTAATGTPPPAAFTQPSQGAPLQPPLSRSAEPPVVCPGLRSSYAVNAPNTSTANVNGTNKVTPLRRRPIWSTPTDATPARIPQRDRRPPNSVRPRQAPRPVLVGIRLLILGIGIAAITGTILSTFNAKKDTASSNAATADSTNASSGWGRRDQTAMMPAQSLPVAEELMYLETDLVELGSLTPGLSQSIFFYDLDTGNFVDLNGTAPIASASTIKLPILVAFLEAVDAGTLRLDQAITLQEDLIAGGSGDMQTYEVGSQHTALQVATEMIVNSDNTATNMIITLLGGQDLLNRRFTQWGLQSTVLRNPLPDLEGTNTTSPADLARLLALVDSGDLLKSRSRDRLFSTMQRTYNRTLIPDGLGDSSALTFNKTGDIGTALGDIALVDLANGKRYILGVIIDRPHNDGRAGELIRRIASRVHEEMNQPVSPIGGSTTPSSSQPTANPQLGGSNQPDSSD